MKPISIPGTNYELRVHQPGSGASIAAASHVEEAMAPFSKRWLKDLLPFKLLARQFPIDAHPASWSELGPLIERGDMSDDQIRKSAKHLYKTLLKHYPNITQINLLSACTGSGRAEAYFAAFLQEKGIAVEYLLAIDTCFDDREKPAFLTALQEHSLVSQGQAFADADEANDWLNSKGNPSFHAAVMVQYQFANTIQETREAFIQGQSQMIIHNSALANLLRSKNPRGEPLPLMLFSPGDSDQSNPRIKDKDVNNFAAEIDKDVERTHHRLYDTIGGTINYDSLTYNIRAAAKRRNRARA